MYVEQLYTNCLAEAAYYIESEGEAAIIDPMRESEPYLQLAKQRGTRIKYIFETHFHADFVSGHLDLAKKTGATIIYGPNANPNYEVIIAQDNQQFMLGKVTFKVLHTPGHTPESSCYLLLDEQQKAHCVFTGDTLFIGDVGRPDLATSENISQESLATLLYHSLQNKIKSLPDDVIVYPAHGAGSSCGKNIGKERSSTIGLQKQFNYALQEMTEADFVTAVTEDLSAPPKYFFKDALINKQGYDNLEEVLKRTVNPLNTTDFQHLAQDKNYLILDAREPDTFAQGFVKGSINIGLNGQYAIWVGTLLDDKKSILLVCDLGKEQEAIVRLARIGYENVAGYLEGGFEAWQKASLPTDKIENITATAFAEAYATHQLEVLDVRNPSEWHNQGVLQQVELIALAELTHHLPKLSTQKTYHIHCAGGYRSMIAASILKLHGFDNIVNVAGGFAKIKETNLTIEKAKV